MGRYEYQPVPVEQLADYLNTSEGHEFTFHPTTLVRNAIRELYAIKMANIPFFYMEAGAAERLITGKTRFAVVTNEPKPGPALPLYVGPQPFRWPDPIGEVRLGERDDSNSYPDARVACLHEQADWENFPDGTKLYLGPSS